MEAAFGTAYLVEFCGLALGAWLFSRRLDPAQKKYWQPRLSLASVVILAPFFVIPLLFWRQWLMLPITLIFLGFIAWGHAFRTRVCDQCGTIVPPQQLITPARYCPKCGAPLSREKIFGRKDHE